MNPAAFVVDTPDGSLIHLTANKLSVIACSPDANENDRCHPVGPIYPALI